MNPSYNSISDDEEPYDSSWEVDDTDVAINKVEATSELGKRITSNHSLQSIAYIFLLVLVCTAAVFATAPSIYKNIVSGGGGGVDEDVTVDAVESTDDLTRKDDVSTTDSSSLDGSDFIVQRNGYKSLPYFNSRSDVTAVGYKILDPYDSLIEPHVNSSLVYLGTDSDKYFEFDIVDSTKGETLYSGTLSSGKSRVDVNAFKIECNPYDEVDIYITTYDSIGKQTNDSTVVLKSICLYVRREIRDLSEDDLLDTISAMYEIWSVPEQKGRDTYGDNFHSSSWFAAMHDFNAAWRDGDHIHEGLGFLPQHMKMTNTFELAIQSVNPAVCLFYWDFTIDNAEGLALTDSPMFQTKTFGKLSEPADSYWGWTYRNDSIMSAAIKTGKWQNTKAESNPIHSDIQNGFGYMRGPWNMNPSPSLTRFYSPETSSVPSCLSYYKWLEMTDFEDFFQESENGPHAATHGAIGGVYGCDLLDELREQNLIKDADSQLTICAKWGFYMKEMYRSNYISPEVNCVADQDLSYDGVKCSYFCRDEAAEGHVKMMQSSINLGDYLPDNITDDGWYTWRDFICDGNGYKIFVGDHLESASTADPSFWPIHPTQERLLQLKYMVGGFTNSSWPTTTSARGAYVCNHANCYMWDDLSQPKDFYDGCCYGHFEYDQLLDFTTWNRTNYYGPTNHQILLDADPSTDSYAMPYIYDDFSWDHCEEDFDGLIDRLAIMAGL